MKQIIKYIALLIAGGLLYAGCELIFRGYTFKSMILVGGICFVLCGLINESMEWKTPLPKQMLICMCVITVVELLAGLILNVWLKLGVWDYSKLPFNLWGQICPQFSALWFALSLPAILIDDQIRWQIFGEEKPRYYMTKRKDNFRCAAMAQNGFCRRYREACVHKVSCKTRSNCGECKSYMIPRSQQPCKGCEHLRV